MATDNFYKTGVAYQRLKDRFEEMHIPDTNKKLVKEFLESCQLGLYGQTLSKIRALRTFRSLVPLCELLPPGKVWHDVTKLDIRAILLNIHEHTVWGEWEKYVTLMVLRKFVTWLRTEHGYPEGYTDRDRLINQLPLLKNAPEVNYRIQEVRKVKSVNEIPTAQEIEWMMDACTLRGETGLRDRAILVILEEVGVRIGGLGGLRISDVIFDELGAKIIVHDKTMRGEPVRIIKSVPYLREWLNVHPLKDDPGAPLWVNLRGDFKAMAYHAINKALKSIVKMHNKIAEIKGTEKITRRIHFHAFRYYAQTRDMMEGMPVSVQCAQRGWSPTSKQPLRYARVTTQLVDQYLSKKYGLASEAESPTKKPVQEVLEDRQPKPQREIVPGYA